MMRNYLVQLIVSLSLLISLVQSKVLAQSPYAIAQEKEISDEERVVRGDKLKGYYILSDIGIPVQVNVLDTITLGTHHYLTMEQKSLGIAYKGNFDTPYQSKVFFDRPFKEHDFIYFTGYQGLLYEPNKALFYDTKTAFTFVNHNKNFDAESEEEATKGTMSLNLGKAINLGLNMQYTHSKGFYTGNKSKNFRYRLFGSFRSNRYELWSFIANDYYKMSENGGLTATGLDQLQHPDKYSSGRVKKGSHDIETVLPPNALFNRIRSGHFFLNHRYNFGYYQKEEEPNNISLSKAKKESKEEEKEKLSKRKFIPVASLSHQFYYNKASRRFISKNSSVDFSKVFPSVAPEVLKHRGVEPSKLLPNDTAELRSFKNTIALSLQEGFRPWVKFGLSAYVRAENYIVSNPDIEHKSYKKNDHYFSGFIGGELTRYSGKGLNFRIKSELGLLGRDLGSFLVDGYMQSQVQIYRRLFSLRLDGHLENYRPAYFYEHLHGTYAWWDRSFNFSRRLDLSSKLSLDSWGTWASLHSSSLQNYIYWNKKGQLEQASELIQVGMLRVGHRHKWGFFAWDLEGAYQQSSNTEAIPLPLLIARADLCLDFLVAGVMEVQLGLEGYYHTTYYAPEYRADTQQFLPQNKQKIGGKTPLLNAYANFRLKGIRFYTRMYNVGESLWANDRLSSYLYPYNPMHLQAGIAVDLDR